MRQSKEEYLYSVFISITLIVILILSFTDCVTVTHHPSLSGWSPNSRPITTNTTGYLPVFICILTAAQLLLIWLVRKKFACIIGVLLNIIAAAFPVFYMTFSSQWGKTMSTFFYDYEPAYNEYVFGMPVYVILGLGAAVTVFYFVLLHFRRKRIDLEKLAKLNETANFFAPENGGTLGNAGETDDISE